MPELPDVETFKRYIESTALHQKIRDVAISDSRIVGETDSSNLAKTLQGHSFERALRHGKYCLLQLDDERYLALHFGMTGFVKYYKNEDKKPAHVRLICEFDNNYTLAYDSQRRLGRIELTDDVEAFLAGHELGPDAMASDFSEDDFINAVAERRGTLKSTLMNQQIIAGIGNVYSDEILFQERLHPKTAIADLREEQLRSVFKIMRKVLQEVMDSGIDKQEMPETLLTRHRAGDMHCPSCGGKIEKIKVSGRNSCYCPSCQSK